MSALYLGYRCRQLLEARGANLKIGIHPRLSSSFISFRDAVDRPREKQSSALNPPSLGGIASNKPLGPDQFLSQIRNDARTPFDDADEALDASTRHHKSSSSSRSRSSKRLHITHRIIGPREATLVDDIGYIERLLAQGIPVKDILVSFKSRLSFQNLSDRRMKSTTRLHQLRGTSVFQKLFLTAIHERLSEPQNPSRPRLAQVISIYLKYGLMMDNMWDKLFWRSLAKIWESDLPSRMALGELISRPEALTITPTLKDIIHAWKLFMRKFGTLSADLSKGKVKEPKTPTSGEQPAVMSLVHESLQITQNEPANDSHFRTTSGSLRHDFHDLNHRISSPHSLRMAALLTLMYIRWITRQENLSDMLTADAEPILRSVTDSMQGYSGIEIDEVMTGYLMQEKVMPPYKISFSAEWARLRDESLEDQHEKHFEGDALAGKKIMDEEVVDDDVISLYSNENGSGSVTPKSQPSTVAFLLHRAAKTSNLDFAMKLWHQHMGTMTTGQLPPDADILRNFMTAFVELGRSDLSTTVWNTTVKHNIEPSRQHWIGMLEICKKERDLKSLRILWQLMKAKNVPIENRAWSIYIGGLLQGRDWLTTLKEMEQMNAGWKKAMKLSNTQSTKLSTSDPGWRERYGPSIVPINVAISGMLRLREPDVAQKIFEWATIHGVKPDIVTFNTYLGYAVNQNHGPDQKQSILRDMERNNCKPDTVTFSILLNGLFRDADPSSETEAVRIFDEMEAHGIDASAPAYGIALSSLLAQKDVNGLAARAVLARMADKGLPCSHHINTMLLRHYFSTSPPSLAAIDALWRRVQGNGLAADHILIDQLIEGYARVGQIERMMAVLRAMPGAGQRPRWTVLVTVLRTLVEAGEWDLAREFVAEVVDRKHLLKHGSRGWHGKDLFWDLLRDLQERGIDIIPVYSQPKSRPLDWETP